MRTRHERRQSTGLGEQQVSRRALVGGLASMLVAPVLGQTRKFRIGLLRATDWPPPREVLVNKLAALGHREGDNLVVEQVSIDGQPERLPQLVRELLARGVQLVVVDGDGAALAVRAANAKMPVVLVWSLDPVERGLAASLARPGGNVTGLTYDEGTNQATKRLQLFKEAVPGLDTITSFWDGTEPGTAAYWPKIHAASGKLGLRMREVEIRSAGEVPAALERVRSNRPSALLFWGGPAMEPQGQLVADFAIKERLPAFAVDTSVVDVGFLMAYSSNYLDRFAGVAGYVDRILKGTPAGELPIEQPSRFELVVNMKTAKAIGITFPQRLLAHVDRFVE